jgi:hypothetical protein
LLQEDEGILFRGYSKIYLISVRDPYTILLMFFIFFFGYLEAYLKF